MLPINRIGGARGPNGTTLESLLIQLELMNSKLDTLIAATPAAIDISALLDAIGSRSDCTTGESVIGLLCRLNDGVAGTPEPPAIGPAWRCNGVFEGGYIQSDTWITTVGSADGAANVFWAGMEFSYANPTAYVASLTLEGDAVANPTLAPGIVPRSVCMSAYIDTGVELFRVDKWLTSDQTFHSSTFIATVDWSDVWTQGVEIEVDDIYRYRFAVVLTEGLTAVPVGVSLFYTEGGLG